LFRVGAAITDVPVAVVDGAIDCNVRGGTVLGSAISGDVAGFDSGILWVLGSMDGCRHWCFTHRARAEIKNHEGNRWPS